MSTRAKLFTALTLVVASLACTSVASAASGSASAARCQYTTSGQVCDPGGGLPFTGDPLAPLLVAGLALLGVGLGVRRFADRRPA